MPSNASVVKYKCSHVQVQSHASAVQSSVSARQSSASPLQSWASPAQSSQGLVIGPWPVKNGLGELSPYTAHPGGPRNVYTKFGEARSYSYKDMT